MVLILLFTAVCALRSTKLNPHEETTGFTKKSRVALMQDPGNYVAGVL